MLAVCFIGACWPSVLSVRAGCLFYRCLMAVCFIGACWPSILSAHADLNIFTFNFLCFHYCELLKSPNKRGPETSVDGTRDKCRGHPRQVLRAPETSVKGTRDKCALAYFFSAVSVVMLNNRFPCKALHLYVILLNTTQIMHCGKTQCALLGCIPA